MNRKRFVIGVSGASGIIYAERLLSYLSPVAEIHLVVTPTAAQIAAHEGISLDREGVIIHAHDHMAAPIASGSFRHQGMVILPCSMKTLASVASGITANLLTRAADVTLKEERPLLLLLRENPLSRVHLRNMMAASEAGATIMIASPPFYHRPVTIDDLIDAVIARVLDHLDIEHTIGGRWGE